MILLDLEQKSPEWLEYRRTSLTATDFCIVAAEAQLCPNLFGKSVDSLIQSKLSAELVADNKYFAKGRELEPVVMDSLQDITIIESEVIVYEKNERFMSSLDGRNGTHIIETKTTSKSKDKFPELVKYYSHQVAHQCYCAGYDKGLLVIAWLDENWEIKEITKTEIIAKKVITKKLWNELSEAFIAKLDNANKCPVEVLKTFDEYKEVDNQLKQLEIKKENLRTMLINKYPNGTTFCEFSINKQIRKSTRYSDWVKDNKLIVPEQYVTPGTVYVIKSNIKENQ